MLKAIKLFIVNHLSLYAAKSHKKILIISGFILMANPDAVILNDSEGSHLY